MSGGIEDMVMEERIKPSVAAAINRSEAIDDDSAPEYQPENKTALDVQIGGNHYKKLKIQPVEYIMANELGFCEGSAIKYITRWRDKGGIQDIDKAIHFLQILKASLE